MIRITLEPGCPLAPLGALYSKGIPIKSLEPSLSIYGTDCYEVVPPFPPGLTKVMAERVIDTNLIGVRIIRNYAIHRVLGIPTEWAIMPPSMTTTQA